jgi:hypothetical protein
VCDVFFFCALHLYNCLGALDGTPVKVTVPASLKGRYRSRKADIVINVLGVCAHDMQFIYVLPGWEGSVHDGRVLQDALSRPNELRLAQGKFYLRNFKVVYWYTV